MNFLLDHLFLTPPPPPSPMCIGSLTLILRVVEKKIIIIINKQINKFPHTCRIPSLTCTRCCRYRPRIRHAPTGKRVILQRSVRTIRDYEALRFLMPSLTCLRFPQWPASCLDLAATPPRGCRHGGHRQQLTAENEPQFAGSSGHLQLLEINGGKNK